MRFLLIVSLGFFWLHYASATKPILNLGQDYSRIISISGFQNDCFFNAIRHAGIPINRQILLDRIQRHAEDERWQTAILLLAQQEIFAMDPNDLDADPAPLVQNPLNWFLQQLENGAPIPFHAYREAWEEQIPDFIDLLGEEFDFDVRIVQQIPRSNSLQVMRDFRRELAPTIRRITLQYTNGPVGHFDLVVNGTEENGFYDLFSDAIEIGRGSQGAVMRCSLQNTPCAVKHTNHNMLSRRERDILSQCDHPRILRYFESFESHCGSYLAIVTEYVSGSNLKRFLENQYRRLEDHLIIDIFSQIVSAVDHLHQKSGIHRDIKAENILIDRRGQIKLCDFGLSKVDPNVTHTSGCQTRCGTRNYLAPELLLSSAYGQSVDIWALGILLFYLSEGQHPFTGLSIQQMLNQIHSPYRLSLSRTRNSSLDDLLHRLLNPDPAQRPTAEQILAILESLRWNRYM